MTRARKGRSAPTSHRVRYTEPTQREIEKQRILEELVKAKKEKIKTLQELLKTKKRIEAIDKELAKGKKQP